MISLKNFVLFASLVLPLFAAPTGQNSREQDVEDPFGRIAICELPKGCVFKAIFEEDHYSADLSENFSNPASPGSIEHGLGWLVAAQRDNGGWGAGSHYRQDIHDPQAVNTDPATTAMAAMALLRTGSSLSAGKFSGALKKATIYLLSTIEAMPEGSPYITHETDTQIQVKLGNNIDAILALQFLSEIVEEVQDQQLAKRIRSAMNVCAAKIERNQGQDGSMNGAGWAGVLQSSLATNALESAQMRGAEVDEDALEQARNYQKNNYDTQTGNVKTEMGAGIVLYSVSGTARATAKDARKVKEELEKAQREGRIRRDAEVTPQLLEEIGYAASEASTLAGSYQTYTASKMLAQDDGVMTGFGNNGGEEFLSYLQTAESLIINQDASWHNWYGSMADRMVAIQNPDGSWNGHHCITSPVFCTATALLILSVEKDIDRLQEIGNN